MMKTAFYRVERNVHPRSSFGIYRLSTLFEMCDMVGSSYLANIFWDSFTNNDQAAFGRTSIPRFRLKIYFYIVLRIILEQEMLQIVSQDEMTFVSFIFAFVNLSSEFSGVHG